MSSAILYLAIVAIWACVLIPRWLRRDTARSAAAPATVTPPAGSTEATESGAEADDDGAAEDDGADEDVHRWRMIAPEPVSPEEARRRMLAARRRLLLMLTGLEVAAIALAILGLAAVWVVIPPSIMLAGYLLLLREASAADAEHAKHDAEAAERARAHTRSHRHSRAAERVTPVDGTSTEGIAAAAAALAAKFAAAPVPADYQDGPGRDFAPGLAGKYTTSNAEPEAEADEEYYEPYEDTYQPPRLRAVGD
jgi:hypothetical protein